MQRFDGTEIYTREQLRELYPDKWFVVIDAVVDSALAVLSGKLIAICDDLEINVFVDECIEKGITMRYDRTTELNSWCPQGLNLIEYERTAYIKKLDDYLRSLQNMPKQELRDHALSTLIACGIIQSNGDFTEKYQCTD